ncbi:hypothetical protein ACH3XW_31290 [Acanthocheilonema viteae]
MHLKGSKRRALFVQIHISLWKAAKCKNTNNSLKCVSSSKFMCSVNSDGSAVSKDRYAKGEDSCTATAVTTSF